MTAAVDLEIKDPNSPPALKFPARFVHCGRPQEEKILLGFNMGVEKRSKAVLLELSVPMCKDCAAKERRITSVTLVPFLISGLLVGALAFVPAWLIAPDGTAPQTPGFPFAVGGRTGLIARELIRLNPRENQ
jgi:hypothetical protein